MLPERGENIKLSFIKIKNFCSWKYTIKNLEMQTPKSPPKILQYIYLTRELSE